MSPAVSLNKAKESMLFKLDLEQSKNLCQKFTFSKQYNRIVLSGGFEQKAPSILVTALNVTKIAPVFFFAIEKFSKAAEALLNAGVYLLNSAYGALFNSREIAALDVHKAAEETIEKGLKSTSPLPSNIDMAAISFEEPAFRSSVKEPQSLDAALSADIPADDASIAKINTDVLQNLQSLEKVIAAPEAASYIGNDAEQSLTSFAAPKEDLANREGPALSPAPALKTKNALIGGGLVALASAVSYGVAYYFNILPDSLNFFGSNEDQEPVNGNQEPEDGVVNSLDQKGNNDESNKCVQDAESSSHNPETRVTTYFNIIPDFFSKQGQELVNDENQKPEDAALSRESLGNVENGGSDECVQDMALPGENIESSDENQEFFGLNNLLYGGGLFCSAAALVGGAKYLNIRPGSIYPFGKNTESDPPINSDSESHHWRITEALGSGVHYLSSLPGQFKLFGQKKTQESSDSTNSDEGIVPPTENSLTMEETKDDPSEEGSSVYGPVSKREVEEFKDFLPKTLTGESLKTAQNEGITLDEEAGVVVPPSLPANEQDKGIFSNFFSYFSRTQSTESTPIAPDVTDEKGKDPLSPEDNREDKLSSHNAEVDRAWGEQLKNIQNINGKKVYFDADGRVIYTSEGEEKESR